MKNKIPLIQLFISIQGEGKDQGKLSTFLRFKKCNLKCAFCDTYNKMETIPESFYNIEDIIDLGEKTNYNFIITGGEPTLKIYRDYILNIISMLNKKNINVSNIDFETNGFKMNELYNDIKNNINNEKILSKINFTYSPKYMISNQIDFCNNIINIKQIEEIANEILEKLNQLKQLDFDIDNNLVLKLIMVDKKINFINSVNIIDKLIDSNIIKTKNIFIMPEGISKEDILTGNKYFFDICFKKRINFSSRLHILHSFE